MMNFQIKKFLMIISILISIIILSPTLTFVSAQTLTPTLILNARALTNTPSPIITFSPTLTPSSTIAETPTPASVSISEIKEAFANDIKEIRTLLNRIDANTTPENPTVSFLKRAGEDAFSNTLWTFLGTPLVAGLLAFLGPISIIGKFLIWLRRNKNKFEEVESGKPINKSDSKEGESNNVSTSGQPGIKKRKALINFDGLDRFFNIVIVFIVMLTTFMVLSLLTINRAAGLNQPVDTNSVAALSEKISILDNKIQILIDARPQNAPTITTSPTVQQQIYIQPSLQQAEQTNPDPTMMLFTSIALGVILFGFFFFPANLIARFQAQTFEVKLSKDSLQEISMALLPAIFLTLILYLLPYPSDTILLPLLIPFFIFAFFDVVRIYPNVYIKNIVVNHFSKIIFLAEFGVWYEFLSVIKNYTYSFWYIYQNIWESSIRVMVDTQIPALVANTSQKDFYTLFRPFLDRIPYLIPQFFWDFFPFLIALIFAFAPWRHVYKIAKANHIVKIQQSMKAK